jgi:hypothetical protein
MPDIPPETALYPPVVAFLEAQGFTVRGEVGHADVVGVRGNEVVIVELKRTLNLAVLAQAVRGLAVSPSVYVAVPRPANKAHWMRRMKSELAVVRRLEVGLLLVAPGGRVPVDPVLHPEPLPPRQRYPRKRAILREVARRSADYNTGGSVRRKLVTAYRKNAIHVAVCLQARGPQTPKALRALGTGDHTLAILRRNVYGWFERPARGVYALTPRGVEELAAYPELAARYLPGQQADEGGEAVADGHQQRKRQRKQR